MKGSGKNIIVIKLRPNVFSALTPDTLQKAVVEKIDIKLSDADLRAKVVELIMAAEGAVDFLEEKGIPCIFANFEKQAELEGVESAHNIEELKQKLSKL